MLKFERTMVRGIAILVTIAPLWACSSESSADRSGERVGSAAAIPNVEAVVHDTTEGGAGLDVTEAIGWELESRPVLAIGVADGAPEQEFAGIIGVSFLGDSLIAVGDAGSRQLRIFDRQGAFVRAMARQGSGPGELEWPRWFSTCGTDTLFVHDIKGSILSRFSVDGRLVGRAVLRIGPRNGPPRALSCGPAGTLVATATTLTTPDDMRQPGPYRGQTSVLLVDHDGNAKATLGTFPAGEEYFLGRSVRPRPLGKLTLIAADHERVYVGTGDSYAVTILSPNGEQLGELSANVPPRRITGSDRESWIDAQVAGIKDPARREDDVRYYRGLMYPDEYPAYGALVVADDGSLWIGDFDPLERPPSQWRVFGRDGQMVGRITTPTGFELYEIRQGELLGRERDAEGVERVVIYRRRTPAHRPTT